MYIKLLPDENKYSKHKQMNDIIHNANIPPLIFEKYQCMFLKKIKETSKFTDEYIELLGVECQKNKISFIKHLKEKDTNNQLNARNTFDKLISKEVELVQAKIFHNLNKEYQQLYQTSKRHWNFDRKINSKITSNEKYATDDYHLPCFWNTVTYLENIDELYNVSSFYDDTNIIYPNQSSYRKQVNSKHSIVTSITTKEPLNDLTKTYMNLVKTKNEIYSKHHNDLNHKLTKISEQLILSNKNLKDTQRKMQDLEMSKQSISNAYYACTKECKAYELKVNTMQKQLENCTYNDNCWNQTLVEESQKKLGQLESESNKIIDQVHDNCKQIHADLHNQIDNSVRLIENFGNSLHLINDFDNFVTASKDTMNNNLNSSLLLQEHLHKIPEICHNLVKEYATNEAYDVALQKSVEISTETATELTNEIATKIATKIATEISNNMMNQISSETTDTTQQIAQEISRDISSEVAHNVASKIAEQVSCEMTHKLEKNISQQIIRVNTEIENKYHKMSANNQKEIRNTYNEVINTLKEELKNHNNDMFYPSIHKMEILKSEIETIKFEISEMMKLTKDNLVKIDETKNEMINKQNLFQSKIETYINKEFKEARLTSGELETKFVDEAKRITNDRIEKLREEAQSTLEQHLNACTMTLNSHHTRLLKDSYKLVNELDERRPIMSRILTMVRDLNSVSDLDEVIKRTSRLESESRMINNRVNEAEQGVNRVLTRYKKSDAQNALQKITALDDGLRRVTTVFVLQIAWCVLTYIL